MLVYKGKNEKIIEAVRISNDLLKNKKGLLTSVRHIKVFDDANCTGSDIVNAITKINIKYTVTVVAKRPWNPFTKMVASFNPNRPLEIKLNACKLRRSKHSIVGSTVHEYIHVVDNQYSHLSFGHGTNSSHGKGNTAPYKIGYMSKLLSETYYKWVHLDLPA